MIKSIDPATVIFALAFIVEAVRLYFLKKEKKHDDHLSYLKNQAYQLFLYAEKQGWSGSEKMAWVSAQVHERIPFKVIQSIVGEQMITEWLQSTYNEFKESLLH